MKSAPSLTTDPISSLIWRIALPMSIGMFFNTMFNVVDTYYAGKLGTEALAALALSFPVFFIILSVGSGISQGSKRRVERCRRRHLATGRCLCFPALQHNAV